MTDIERETLLKLMHSPLKTLAEVRRVQALAFDWLKTHPDDDAVLGAGESLRMLAEALKSLPK